jgi:hypothetical protein
MASGLALSFLTVSSCVAGVTNDLTITSQDGAAVPLQAEDLAGIKARPLAKIKERFDGKQKKDFVQLYVVTVKAGDVLRGAYTLKDGPYRLTAYHITKEAKGPRTLRVVSTRFHEEGATATFEAKVEKREEDLFLITAEKVASADELNSHLKYMASQNNEVLLRGYSPNWTLTALKFKMSGKEGLKQGADDFEKDADWLIEALVKPEWILAIRVEAN